MKKSFYLFLTALMGSLIFLVLHRIIIFLYLYLLAGGFVSPTVTDYFSFTFYDYFSLVIVMMLGAWYGIWLGLYWYQMVYEDQTLGGFSAHVASTYFPSRPRNYESKMSAIKQRLVTDLGQFEQLTEESALNVDHPVAVKRTVVRKRAPRKLNGVK